MQKKTQPNIKAIAIILFIIISGLGLVLIYINFINNKANEDSNSQIEIIWWTLWEDTENLEILAQAYRMQHPNVTITIEKQEIEDLYQAKLLETLGGNLTEGTPDIVRIHNTWLPMFENYLSPLPSSVMSQDEYTSRFYAATSYDFTGKDGQLYAAPIMFDGLGLYYNKTLLKKAGYTAPEDTWDSFLTQAKHLTQYDDEGKIKVAGASIGTADNIDFAFDIINLLMLQEGATVVGPNGQTTFDTDEDMRVAKALKFYTDFTTRHEIWDRTLPRDITMFSEGRLAMMFAPSWRVFDINNALEGGGDSLDYSISPVPQQPTITGDKITWATYWGEAVSKKSTHPEVAWDFLKFITETQQLQDLYQQCKGSREFGNIYPRPDMAEEIISDKYVGAYLKMADNTQTWRMVDKAKVSTEFRTLIKTIVASSNMSVQEIQNLLKEDVAPKINQILIESSND